MKQIGYRIIEFDAHDLHRLLSWITDGTVPSPSDNTELKRVLVSGVLGGVIGLEIESNWQNFTWDSSGRVPFAIDVRYHRGEEKSVAVFDEKGIPLRRQTGPNPLR